HPEKILKPEQMYKAVDVIINRSNSYVKHSHNYFVYGFSGHLFHNGISELSATSLIGKLCKAANDEDADDRLDVVTETYRKGKAGKLVKGISQLKYVIEKYNDENEGHVNEIIAELNQAFNIGVGNNKSMGSNTNVSN